MSGNDLRCEVVEQDNGSWTLTITVTSLTFEQAGEISEGLRLPVRDIVLAALNKEGGLVVVRDMGELPH